MSVSVVNSVMCCNFDLKESRDADVTKFDCVSYRCHSIGLCGVLLCDWPWNLVYVGYKIQFVDLDVFFGRMLLM